MLDDKYRVERLLAAGGMGEVYLGTHIGLRKRVAIKVLNPQTSTAAVVERFHREAITASQIGHEGIAQVTDIGTSNDGEPFLVMEYLEGESLASRLTVSGPLALEDACEIGCAILSPLAAAHRAGVVHRDLKPDNVFLVRQSRGEMVKLLDFGISRFTGLERDFRLTATGLVLGTPYYMSPEQARGDSTVTTASDLYAFGVILYEMLVGDVPIRADNYNALMYRVTMGDFQRPRERRRDVPQPLEHIILCAMAQTPADRPRARELETALLPFCRQTFRDHGSGRITATGPRYRTPAPAEADDSLLALDPATFTGVTEPLQAAEPPAEETMPGGSALPIRPDSELTAPTAPTDLRGPMVALPRSRALWVVIAGAIVAAGVLAAVLIARRGTDDGTRTVMAAPELPPSGPATAPPAPDPAPSAPAAPSAPTAPAAAAGSNEPRPAVADPVDSEPEQITLRVATSPPGAVVLLDGERVTGSELVVARDDTLHHLQASSPGYGTYTGTVRFDANKHLSIQLRRNRLRKNPVKPEQPEPPEPPERIYTESPYAPGSQKK
jgi:eukaryotic-like serine/threonine-protein kinase